MGKFISGVRNPKDQSETRRPLYGDAVRVLGDTPAVDVIRKDTTNMVMAIIERGAKVQAGNVLWEPSTAYEYAIGLKNYQIRCQSCIVGKGGITASKSKVNL